MPKNKLFDDNDSEDDVATIKTQNEYAKRYDNWREKEELHKLEQKYGDKDLDAPISSDSEDEDEEPEDMPEEVEAQFLKTLSLLKKKDPRIYDTSYKFFDDVEEGKDKKEEKAEETAKPKKEVNSLAAAFADSDDDEDGDGEIFKVEKKALAPQKPSKEVKIKEYLSGKVEHVDPDEEKDLAPLRALWSDPKISQDEAFLRDYILNKKYLDPDAAGGSGQLLDSAALAVDEELVEEQGRFERAYNFRFEEPDQEYLKRYPRTMSSIRPKDDSRARHRAEVRTRKEEEKMRKMEEIGRLKALKLKEIQEKLARIKEVTGNDELAFKDEDIEGDFDPSEHDRRMRAIFDEEYYGTADHTKPEFPDLDDELEIENWEKYDEEDEDGQAQDEPAPHCEDEDFNMDAEYDPKRARATLLEEIQETLGKKRRNRKRKSKLAKLLETEKPKYIPDVIDKTYDQYMEEYYKMDCEDVIGGDLPTRFKYRETVPNSFGLTIEEILLADDRELNKWASLKKTVKQRPAGVERGELRTYEARAADLQLKRKLLPSLFKDLPEEPEVVVPVEGKKKKKKKNKVKAETTSVNTENAAETGENGIREELAQEPKENTEVVEVKITKKRKHKKDKAVINKEISKKQSDIQNKTKSESNVPEHAQSNTENVGKNKKKHKKQNSNEAPNDVQADRLPKHNIFVVSGSKVTSNDVNAANLPQKKNNKNKNNAENKNRDSSQAREKAKDQIANKLKRKMDTDSKDGPMKKKNKFNTDNKQIKNKNKNKNKKDKQKHNKNSKTAGKEDLMSKLSDERLKAYGLNPKKYRSFLKYKKF